MEGTLENSREVDQLKGKVIEIPIVDDTLSKAGYSADAKKTGDELALRIKIENIVNDFTSDATNKVASASTVKRLKALLDNIPNKYIPNTGGFIDGDVKVRNVDNGYGEVSKNNSASDDYGTQLVDVSKDGTTAKVVVSALLGLLNYVDTEGNIRNIHHEGNKPFGSYTGNGTSTTRTIDTKGIGRLLLLYNKDNFNFVTPQGALSIDTSAKDMEWVDSTKVNFLNGTLTLNTLGEAFNINGKEYYYQVI